MCKLAYIRTKNNDAYKQCVDMVKFQENVVAGHSTGFAYLDNQGFHIRKSIGKTNSFLNKYSDFPSTKNCLGHSRYATVGVINLDNQHPIPIIVKGKTIAYAIHNGKWGEYENYEYLRSSIKNKTDSALLFTMFGKMLEKIGDNPINRRIAFGYIMSLIVHEANHNLIINFRDGSTLFSGNVLSYKVTPEVIAIMTFGLPEKTVDNLVFEIKGFEVKKYNMIAAPFRFKSKPPKVKKTGNALLKGMSSAYPTQTKIPGWYS